MMRRDVNGIIHLKSREHRGLSSLICGLNGQLDHRDTAIPSRAPLSLRETLALGLLKRWLH